MIKIIFISFFSILLNTVFATDIIKQSRTKICHDENSPYYKKIKHFKKFDSLDNCLKDGGRLPAKQKKKRKKKLKQH